MHQEMGILLSQMEAAEVPTVEHDPLEGKAVEGFDASGLNHNTQNLWSLNGRWGVTIGLGDTTPHHLTRVTERTVGRFYLIERCSGDNPTSFALYLGETYVKWSNTANSPIFVGVQNNTLSMYEVTPTEQ